MSDNQDSRFAVVHGSTPKANKWRLGNRGGIFKSGDLGYIWVSYTLTATPKGEGEVINEDSKTLFIVRRQSDNHWKIARLMDNSNST